MGSDDFFKKHREERKKRKYEYKQPHANSYLIVTEGERTEPLYFKGMVNIIERKMGGNVDVYELPTININGEGCSTCKLIEKTDELISKAKIIYQNIWLVFDKDDFNDFDDAIKTAENKGYKVAWSNQSFEYWLYLHFNYSDSALHRDIWNNKLSEIFEECDLGEGKYYKNYDDIYNIVDLNDGVNTAIKNAKRRMDDYLCKNVKPSKYDPGTTVHLLVLELKKYLDE
ncbi:RloB family protein [Anaerocolumna xylanovorans]|uniref:RloB-like protein n=1 Tax=Anaerocolumna xylanovorans DSM 12503 TaxID=1121345 RepID=A0A1M7Y6S4_9FIRM|nr:RloB family protein [Anaerocolumna xylanovorans]SHO48365.1 RloB-like protein [Anaerocolumna xylanovorans DSM 12503]